MILYFCDISGLTLLSVATSSALTPGLYDQIKYLIDRKASPSVKDVNGLNAVRTYLYMYYSINYAMMGRY